MQLRLALLAALACATGYAQSKPAADAEPSSRDALFGDAAGAEPEVSARVSGFYEFTLAYTYADPKHWSRAVNRLALDGRGDLASGVKWKLGARFDVDPVYMLSDFYLQDVKKNQRATAIWRENYLDFDVGAWDFRVGAQNIIWGDVVGLFVADVVSARDLRDFLLPSFDVIRIPQWAARAEYRKAMPTSNWCGFRADLRQHRQAGFRLLSGMLPSPTPVAVAAAFQNWRHRKRWRTRATVYVRTPGWRLGYRGVLLPQLQHLADVLSRTHRVAAQPFVFQPRYDRIWQGGRPSTKISGAWCCTVEGGTRTVRTSGRWTWLAVGWWRGRQWTDCQSGCPFRR